MQKLMPSGFKFQLNLLSLSGYYGAKIKQCADLYLKEGIYQFAGTDLHHSFHLEALQKMKRDEKISTKLSDYTFHNDLLSLLWKFYSSYPCRFAFFACFIFRGYPILVLWIKVIYLVGLSTGPMYMSNCELRFHFWRSVLSSKFCVIRVAFLRLRDFFFHSLWSWLPREANFYFRIGIRMWWILFSVFWDRL